MLLKKYFKTRYITLTRTECENKIGCQLCIYWDNNTNSNIYRICKLSYKGGDSYMHTVYAHCFSLMCNKLRFFHNKLIKYTYVIKED